MHRNDVSGSGSPAMKYAYRPDLKAYDGMTITSLHRYAVKGLSGDSMESMRLDRGDGTFEDDRRFALLYDTSGDRFDADDPTWLHKVSLERQMVEMQSWRFYSTEM